MSIEGLPDGYGELLAQVKADVLATRLRATRTANAEMVGLYWRVGQLILDRQTRGGWGSRVIDRLSADLRRDLPDQRGWSRTNLTMMRALAETWPNLPIGQHPVNQLPWGHIVQILGRVSGREDRDWYVAQDAANGWTRKVLEHHIATDLHSRALRRATSRQCWMMRTRSWRLSWYATHTCSTSSVSREGLLNGMSSRR